MKNFARRIGVLLAVTFAAASLSPAQADNYSRYNSIAGPNGVPPAFTVGTVLADGRPGQYYFNIGAYAFRHHDIAFAIEMYRVAASWAYKPAEFNLAVLYARGQGVVVDLPRAMAWMRLAAERKNQKYLKALALIDAHLKHGDAKEAEAIFKSLEPRYGDKSALRRARGRWAQTKSSLTGSHTGHPMGRMSVGGTDGTRLFGSDGSVATKGLMSGSDPYIHPVVTIGTMTTTGPAKTPTPKQSKPNNKPTQDPLHP